MAQIMIANSGEIKLSADPATWLDGTTGEIKSGTGHSYGLGDSKAGARKRESYTSGPTLTCVNCYNGVECNGTSKEEHCVEWYGTGFTSSYHINLKRSIDGGAYNQYQDNIYIYNNDACSAVCDPGYDVDLGCVGYPTSTYRYRVEIHNSSHVVQDSMDTSDCSFIE